MDKEILEKLKSYDAVVGIDEVGRGPIAGPVTVAAFMIQKKHYNDVRICLDGITDSKKINEKKRIHYADLIRDLKKQERIEVAISSVSAKLIDTGGISAALHAALKRALQNVTRKMNPEKVFVYLDGSLFAGKEFHQETIIKGDSKNWLIGAASVVAKVARDTQMIQLAEKYSEYGFEKHKGYGTKGHYAAIVKKGLCDIHRKTWIKLD